MAEYCHETILSVAVGGMPMGFEDLSDVRHHY
jgi:hypothetical protein